APNHAAVPSPRTRWLRVALAAAGLAGLALMTHARADLWGNVREQAVLWARLNPDSPRAQANAAQIEMSAGMPARAQARLQRALAAHPDETQLALNLVAARCRLGGADDAALRAAEHALGSAREASTLLTSWFERMIGDIDAGHCPGLDAAEADRLIDAAFANPYVAQQNGRLQDLHYLRGMLALGRMDGAAALAEFNRALDLQVRCGAALRYAATLGTAGFPREGLAHLDHYESVKDREAAPGWGMPRLHAWILARQDYWSREKTRLRATLEADARATPHQP
ncbi:MAG: hypothetical protein QM661_12905, partial [Solimonas sp.]